MWRPLLAAVWTAALGGLAAPHLASATAQSAPYGYEACIEGPASESPDRVSLCAQAWDTTEDPGDVAVRLMWSGQARPAFHVRSMDVQIEYGPGQRIVAGVRPGRLPVDRGEGDCQPDPVPVVRFSDGEPASGDLPEVYAGSCSRLPWIAQPLSTSGRRFVMTAQPVGGSHLPSVRVVRGEVGTIGRIVRTTGTTASKAARPYAVARWRVKLCSDVLATKCIEHVTTAVMAPSTTTRLMTRVRDGATWIPTDTTPYGEMQPDDIWDHAVRDGLVPAVPNGASAADRTVRAVADAVTGASGLSGTVSRKGVFVWPPAGKQGYVWDEDSEDEVWAEAVRDRLVPPDPYGPDPGGRKILPLAEVVGDAGDFGASVVAW